MDAVKTPAVLRGMESILNIDAQWQPEESASKYWRRHTLFVIAVLLLMSAAAMQNVTELKVRLGNAEAEAKAVLAGAMTLNQTLSFCPGASLDQWAGEAGANSSSTSSGSSSGSLAGT